MKYYSATKKKEILSFWATRVALEIIMRNEIGYALGEHATRSHLYLESEGVDPIEIQRRIVVSRAQGAVGRGTGCY
jgi:hypothetical protein